MDKATPVNIPSIIPIVAVTSKVIIKIPRSVFENFNSFEF